MLADGRDLVGIIALEKRLGVVRERAAERVIAGRPMTAEELAAAEKEAQAEVKREYYTAALRRLDKPGETRSDDQHPDARGQRLAEHGLWFSHRGLLALPLVGDPAFADAPAPPTPPATP